MNAQIGMKVTGNYYGAAFSGTIVYERAHTINWKNSLVNIALDAPITVLGETRDTVMMEVKPDGSDNSRYSQNFMQIV